VRDDRENPVPGTVFRVPFAATTPGCIIHGGVPALVESILGWIPSWGGCDPTLARYS
jgi:hypothetical protein